MPTGSNQGPTENGDLEVSLPALPPAHDRSSTPIPDLITDPEDSSDDEYCFIAHPVSKSVMSNATVENCGAKHVPVLNDGALTPHVLAIYENACIDHIEDKQIAAADQVRKLLGGLQGAEVREWFTTDRDRIQKLTFEQFMTELRAEFLDSDWLEEAVQDVLAMVQGENSFKEFIRSLEAANAKLVGTTGHLTKDRLKQQLLVGMSKPLRIRVNAAKINVSITDYKLWKEEVRRIDDMLATIHEEFADVLKKSCIITRNSSVLAEPSRKANTSSANAPSVSNKSSSSGASSVKPPPLTAKEKELLKVYCGCYKCRRLKQTHQSRDCPNGYPSGTGYCEITMSAVPAGSKPEPERKPVVAAVVETRARSESPQPWAPRFDQLSSRGIE